MTLHGRLALVNVIILLIALLSLAAIVLNQLIHDLYEQLDQELGQIGVQELGRVKIVAGSPQFPIPTGSDPQRWGGPALSAWLINRVTSRTAWAITPPQGLALNQTSETGLPLRVYTLPLLANNQVVGYLQVADNREEIEETLAAVRRSLLTCSKMASPTPTRGRLLCRPRP